MLNFFKRLEKTRNAVLLLFAVVMVLSLVLFYRPSSPTLGADLSRSNATAAKVGSQYVTLGELYRQKEMYSRLLQGRPYPAKQVLEGMINNRVMSVEAAKMGLTASDAEVADYIREQFKPADGKPFDQKLYEQNAIDQAGSIAAFEQQMRDDISARKLQALITAGVTVSEQEVVEDFQKKNTKFDVSYVAVSVSDLAATIAPTDADLQEYFNRNKQVYYISVPQKNVRYVFVNTSKLGEKLAIPEEELKAEYDKLPADRKVAGVLGQEIVLRVSKPEFDGQVYEKANQLAERLRKDGPTVSEEAFAELAKGQSENAASAAVGGKLKGPVKENLNNPNDPYQRLLKMKPGEITEPISYQGRYFILRRGEEVPKTWEEARKELEVSMRNRRAYTAAAELAQKVTDTLKQNKNVQATADQYAGQANMTAAEMVKETGFVKPGDDVKDIGNSPQFEEGIAGLENANDVGEKIPVQNGFAIPLLVEKREPRDAELGEVREQVAEAVKQEKARAMIGDVAKQIAAGSTTAGAIAAAAAAKGMKVQEQKAYIVGSPLGQGPMASTSEALSDAIYALKEGEATQTPVQAGDTWYVVGVNKRENANMDDFAKQRDSLTEQMLAGRRRDVFQDFLAAARRRMEADGSIRIYDDVVAKLDEPTAMPNTAE